MTIRAELHDGRILEFPDGTDPAVIDRTVKRELGVADAPAQPVAPVSDAIIPRPGEPPAPETTSAFSRFITGGDNKGVGRALQIGAQGVGRGAAELAGAPVDLAAAALNLSAAAANALGGNVPYIANPVGGSQSIREAAESVYRATGAPPLVEEAEMSPGQKLGYNVNRLGVQSIAGSGVGARLAAQRAAEGSLTPRMSDAFVRPYMDDARKAFTGDAAAGVGAGTAVTAAPEDSPLAQGAAAILGGVGGAAAAQAARGGPQALARLATARAPSGVDYDPQAPFVPIPNVVVDKARQVLHGAALNPDAAKASIAAGRATLPEGAPSPTMGVLSEDPGLIGLEQTARGQNRAPFIERDNQIRDYAAQQVREARPAGTPEGDANRGAQQFAKGRAGAMVGQAQRQQTAAEQNLAAANQRLQNLQTDEAAIAAPVAMQRGAAKAETASQRLDETVTGELSARTTTKNTKFEGIDPDKKTMVDIAPIAKTAAALKASVGALSPEASGLPPELVRKLDKLAAKPPDAMAPLTGDTGAAAQKVALGDLVEARKYLNTAADKAQRAGNYDLADNVRTLKRQINEQIDAAPQSAEAQRYYREEYAPFFAQGPGRKFRDRIQSDPTGRTALPPSGVAKFWLENGEERAAHLARILHASRSRAEGEGAVRNFMVSDLARAVDQRGQVNLSVVNRWIADNANVLRHFPELEREVTQFRAAIATNQAGQSALKQEIETLAGAVRAAEKNVLGTQKAIDDGMLGVLIGNSPENAARKVLSASDPVVAAREMNALLNSASPNVRQGVKDSWAAAVADHIRAKVRTTRETPGGEGVLSYSALVREFHKNEAVLAEIFRDTPNAMNKLRQAQKALAPLTRLEQQATRGSATAENQAALRALEIGLKLRYGGLEGGNKFRALRLALAAFGPNDGPAVARLVERSMLEPRVADFLWAEAPRAVGTPAWNARLNSILGVAEGARTNVERRDEKR